MEDPAILRLNHEHYRRLLEVETNPLKRSRILALLREIDSQLGLQTTAADDPPSSDPS